VFEELITLLGRDAKREDSGSLSLCVSTCVCVCVCIPEGWEGRLGQMVHKGVTTQWVGTAIDALQHPRRWNIWLLTRSQSSLALPSPYLAALREPTGDLVRINTHWERSTFPPWRKPARAVRWKLLPCLCKEVMMVVQAGRMSAQSHGDKQRRNTGLLLHLDGENLTLRMFWGAFVSKATPYVLISASNA